MQKNIRQLAAVMFTDMVGYTALMQTDEHKAKKNRDRHRKILEKSIQDHHGLILQYYGDGTLSVFGSAIEAIECAVEIQRELQKEPKIPLRIGMHVGDIVYSDDGIYGDAVNVAARIEKLSVPGGVLISDKVYDEIKNHHEFSTTTLGEFELKNVKRPVELFALTNEGLQIPTKKALKSSKWKKTIIKVKDTHYPLLETKLYIPQPRPDLVQRTHLIDRLDKGINHKLTLISAPAGFGKTTLISEWISRSEIPVAWVSLDKGDNDPVQFIHYLIAALQNFDASIGQPALTMLQSPQIPPIESVMTSFIKEITDIPNDFVLVLDDYHSVDAKEVHNIVEFLLDHLPAQMHLVITTRVDPPLPLARLRVRNQLTEFRASDLCFSLDEATDFFNKLMNLGLSNHDISILESRTEGWIAGLQLAAFSMQGRKDIPAFIKTFAGDDRHIVDYLAEEVLNLQPEHVQNFLLQTSILNHLSEQLCDFVTAKKGSQKILDELERANLFIIPLDNKRHWYRYHHLFADLLRQRLHQTQRELVPELHSRASKWYEKNNFKDKAVDHALVAGNFEWAAHLIGEFAEVAWEYGRKTRLLKWFKILPAEFICKEPNLCFFHAWVLFENGQHSAAEESLQVVEQLIDSIIVPPLKESGGLGSSDKVELQGKVAAIRALMATGRGDAQDIIKFSRQAFECLPEGDSTWRASVAISSGIAHSIKGDLIAAIDAFSQATIASKAAGNMHLYLVAGFWLIVRLKYAGQLQRAIEICQQLLSFVNEKELAQTLVGGELFVIWGEILYELNELDDALQYLNKGLALVEKGHDVGHLGWSYLCMMRILSARHNISGAEEIIRKMGKLEQASDMPSWVTHLTEAWKARLWLMKGNLDKVADWVEEHGFKLDDELTPLREPGHILLARFLIAQGRLNDAVELLDRLFGEEGKGGRIQNQIETLLVKALALRTQRNTTEAIDTLEMALLLAEPGGYIRIFVDEGPPIAELLEEILDAKSVIPRAYVKKLLSAFRLSKLIKTDDGLVEHLSEREMEVLGLIAGGLSNKKIMEELFLSLSTVKTHIRNIYSKLNVHSRTEVIVKAKEMDLL